MRKLLLLAGTVGVCALAAPARAQEPALDATADVDAEELLPSCGQTKEYVELSGTFRLHETVANEGGTYHLVVRTDGDGVSAQGMTSGDRWVLGVVPVADVVLAGPPPFSKTLDETLRLVSPTHGNLVVRLAFHLAGAGRGPLTATLESLQSSCR